MSDTISFKVAFGKDVHTVSVDRASTVAQLKSTLAALTGVDPPMQRLLFKGVLKDELTIAETSLKEGSKVMMMASSAKDILQVTVAAAMAPAASTVEPTPTRQPLSELTEHKKVISKGKPADAEGGLKGVNLPIPPRGISALLNARGAKTRLTFKLELDELCIATNDHTQKVPLSSIQKVVAEPIAGMEEYYIMGFQLGPTEKSIYWVYFVPAQFAQSIKRAITW
nr:Ubiquitin domain-containing protein ubfd1 [Polyrhizophydium stewartii]